MKLRLITQIKGCWIVRFNHETKLPEILDEHRVILGDACLCVLSDRGAILPLEDVKDVVGVLYAALRPDKEQIAKLIANSDYAKLVDYAHNYWRQK